MLSFILLKIWLLVMVLLNAILTGELLFTADFHGSLWQTYWVSIAGHCMTINKTFH